MGLLQEEVTSEPREPVSPTPARSRRGLWVLALVAGVGWMIYSTTQRDGDIRSAGYALLMSLRSGDLDAAYSRLSAERRRATSRAEFEQLVAGSALQRHDSASLHKVEARSDGYCTLGSLTVGGDEWGVQLFYVEEGGVHRVHSWGLQAPARVRLGVLLEECGYWEGTLVGYSGPPVTLRTRPTR